MKKLCFYFDFMFTFNEGAAAAAAEWGRWKKQVEFNSIIRASQHDENTNWSVQINM